jgi:hypothetical protein
MVSVHEGAEVSMSTNEVSGRVRASDGEREQYAQMVREATGEGRLTLEEGDERLRQIYAAKFRDELRPLVADLPAGAERHAPAMDRPHWAPGRPWPPRPYPGALALHFAMVLMVSTLLVGVWALTGAAFFWPAIPLIFFAMGLIRHARWSTYRRRR